MKSFQITGVNKGELFKIGSMADELNQCHTIVLYAVDISFERVEKAGWGFVYANIKKGTK